MASHSTARRKAALKRKIHKSQLRSKGFLRVKKPGGRMKVRNSKEKRAFLNQL